VKKETLFIVIKGYRQVPGGVDIIGEVVKKQIVPLMKLGVRME